MSNGIDYGMGLANTDHATGIRYGVIPCSAVLQAWSDDSEADYGPPICGQCGNEACEIDVVPFDLDDCVTLCRGTLEIPEAARRGDLAGRSVWKDEGRDYACLRCARSFYSEDAYPDDACGYYLEEPGLRATQSADDRDIFVILSPYYTHGPFCSPCAPGAVYLPSARGHGAKAYCFDPSWFDTDGSEPVTGTYEGQPTTCPYPVYRVSDDVCVFTPDTLK